ncbi:hypothetical protein AB833_28620 [Chromatiales bacterium (ex Bugula neritina AB1)]|nr:hypothetical protein AB833_28620 [Chromatiales bacterium (ex Bugula neritina AB1)]
MIYRKRICLIGAGSGIGRALALKLASRGNRVVISGRNLQALESVAAEAGALSASDSATQKDTANQTTVVPAGLIPVRCDVTDDQQISDVVSRVASELGGLDLLIYCAGRCEYIDNAQLQTALFRRLYDVNVFGLVNAIQAALPLMKTSSDRPHIVGVASLSAVVGLPRAEAYGSSKAAAIYLLNALRLDLVDQNFDVTIVNPGFVETPMTKNNDFPMPFIMQGEEAANHIVAGITRRKRTVNFPLRLWMMLKLAAMFPSIWFRIIGPRLVRSGGS